MHSHLSAKQQLYECASAESLDVKRAVGLRILIGPCVYLVALALAFLNTWNSILLYVLVPVA